MKKKPTAQSGWFSLQLVLCSAAVCSMITGTLLAFFHPEAPAKASYPAAAGLTFAERVAYQRAIEEVYWRHRIWPKERSDLKPSLDAVMGQAQIEKKVTDYLRKSQALRDYWKRPITAEQLQAEIDRMAKHTRQPEVLRELFEALGNDPFLIAECLARPALADRLLRNWFARDQRIHREVRQHGKAGLVTYPTWHRESLESWLARAETQFAMTASVSVGYSLPNISDAADGCIDNTWTALPGPPDGRVGETAVWTGSEMIIWGGNGSQWVLGNGGRYVPTTDSWTPTSNINAPSARSYHTAIWTGSEMIVWGGWDASTYVNTGGRYNPSTDSWAVTATINAPTGRSGHSAAWTGKEMIIWGGADTDYVNTGGRYNPNNDSWTAISTINAPAGRTQHTTVWTGSAMIIWGGGIGGGTSFNTGGRYNPNTDSWAVTSTTNAPTGRELHTGVWTGTHMIVWGGYFYDGSWHYFNTGGRYNPSTDTWTATSTTNAPTARFWHTAVWTGSSEMIVWGGGDDVVGLTNTGGRYNPETNSWTATSTTSAPLPREAHAAVWTGSEMVVWSGVFDQSNTYSDNGGRYDPGTDSWTPVSTGNTPAARFLHTAVWTGTEMIVWGGQVGYPSYLNTGGRYIPSIDNWMATSTTDTPSARNFHTAIWTGTEMIVWGGNEFGFPLNTGARNNARSAPTTPTPTPTPPIPATGGRYDPGTDTWRATSTINAPSLRERHTVVWTGTEMIVWGGSWTDMFGPHYYNSGGRYDPITDSWSGTGDSLLHGRDSHSAVWTGSEMIVWGGYYWDGFDHYLNTGGRLNPGTGIWTPTSEINVPTARSSRTAVWTGNEMIIWGGYDGTNYLNTGGRYHPSTNSWRGTDTANAPTGRLGDTSVWNDNEMIIWGGYDGTSYLDTGGRYNPSSNGWTATSPTGAPAARSFHTAIWTGSEMIVWAGRLLGAQNSHTGARYCAQTGFTPTPTPEPRVTPTPRLHPTPAPRP
jgi:N-acetylneuraminic acid mutarotase